MSSQDSVSSEQAAHAASIASRFRAGETAATERVRQRVSRILAFRGFRIPPQDRADIEQAAMLQVWQAVSRPGFDSRAFWGLVEVVTSRRCIDWLRTRKPETTLDEQREIVDSGADPLGSALRAERSELARMALARLSQRCQELIRLQVDQGRTYQEIAATLGKSEGALRVQMYRCIRQARRVLTEIVDSSRQE